MHKKCIANWLCTSSDREGGRKRRRESTTEKQKALIKQLQDQLIAQQQQLHEQQRANLNVSVLNSQDNSEDIDDDSCNKEAEDLSLKK